MVKYHIQEAVSLQGKHFFNRRLLELFSLDTPCIKLQTIFRLPSCKTMTQFCGCLVDVLTLADTWHRLLGIFILTNFMEQSPSRQANRSSATQ